MRSIVTSDIDRLSRAERADIQPQAPLERDCRNRHCNDLGRSAPLVPFDDGLNAVIRARAGEWLQRPVYEQVLRARLTPPTNRLLAVLKHLRLGRLVRRVLPPARHGLR